MRTTSGYTYEGHDIPAPKTIDERIKALEGNLTCPGTTITRVFRKEPRTGMGWCVALGVLEMPKKFFYGDTIEEAVKEAEKWKRTDRRKK